MVSWKFLGFLSVLSTLLSVEGFLSVSSTGSSSIAGGKSTRTETPSPPKSLQSTAASPSSSTTATTSTTAAMPSPSSSPTKTKIPSTMIESPYSNEELRQALDSLLANSNDRVTDAAHLFGYDKATGEMCESHDLSMLQIITATRILDYQTNAVDELERSTQQSQKQSQSDEGENVAVAVADYSKEPVLNLQTVIQTESPRMALAAEFKRASPSKGVIAGDLHAGEQARQYATAGADIISVLTEPRWFLGTLHGDLTQVRKETTQLARSLNRQRPAILRKDFVVNQRMIDEAVVAGADTVLLIVAVLPKHLLTELITYARATYAMEPLVEIHGSNELQVAIDAGARVIGVNNRNLHTFQMDLLTTNQRAEEILYQGFDFHHHHITFNNSNDKDEKIIESAPPITLCSLSGMSTSFQVDRYRQIGVGMCLIGESLMRASDPKSAIKALCLHPDEFKEFLNSSQSSLDRMGEDAAATASAAGGAYTSGLKLIKVCGITNPTDAVVACRAGADLVGVIFAEKSKRKATKEQAKTIVDVVRAFGERSKRIDWQFDTNVNDGAFAIPHLVLASHALVEGTNRRPAVVGVFQNQSPEFIQEVVNDCGIDLIQLHGSEGFEACRKIRELTGVPAIRVVDVAVDPETGKASETAVETILDSLTNDPIAILLDTSIKGSKEGGGTGVTFDWGIAQRLQDSGVPVLVAGGLTPDNVQECVGSTKPFGIDVSSGVEAGPGVKDHDKVRAFVHGARDAAIEANKGF